MQFFIIVLIIDFVLFLFRLYHVANDDYVLIKKNKTLEDVFNVAFITALIALLISRFFHVFLNPQPVFLNPLGFLLFPYFPGLSLTGGVIGGSIFLLFYLRQNKFPVGRVFDFFTIAFLFALPPGLVGYILLSSSYTLGLFVKLAIYLVMVVLTSFYLYPRASALEIKEGSLSLLFLMFFSLVALLSYSIDNPGLRSFMQNKENFILLGMLLLSIVLIFKQEFLGRVSLGNGK